ncbi:MAG: ATP-binding protein, partial [Leptolyngbya sp.]|nr:ATP-binding protein [Leptolyngbya sp.]
ELDQQHVTLITLLQVAQQQEQQAGSILETIQGYEKGIIVTSMLLAAAIAGLLAWRTTRAIAQPIEAVTQVAQRVALESNFSLRAPATTGDEIGLLAAALNHLIERVEVHTQALEAAATDAKTQTHALEQTLATLRRTQARLLHAEKMSSLGQLVAGVAHEINNPLGFITGNVQYVQEYVEALLAGIDRLQQELPQPSPALQADLANLDLDFIQQDLPQVLQSLQLGTDRITSIVLSLRRFSRLQETDIKPADLHKGLNSTLVILGHRLKANADRPAITVVKDYGDLAPVNCYGGDLNQVFMNILGNAIDAIDERWRDKILPMTPEIRIRTRWGGDQVEVAIANNGNPMPPEVQNRAFDPFFTTKPVGKGTGMGLSISYDIITQKHQGTLVCHSPLDNETYGAEFILTIPHDLIHRRQQSAPLPTDASVLQAAEIPVENGG